MLEGDVGRKMSHREAQAETERVITMGEYGHCCDGLTRSF